MWCINDKDISEVFGVYLKKGAYSSLLSYPTMKNYLTEDVREEQGERVLVGMQRKQARSINLPFYIIADSQSDFWTKYNAFITYITKLGVFEFNLTLHNRVYRLYYQGCSEFSNMKSIAGNGKKVSEFTMTFREPNPNNVYKEELLESEDGQMIITESDVNIKSNVNIY